MSAIVWCLLIDDLSHIISRLSVLLELACLLPASQPDILASQCSKYAALRHLTSLSKRETDRHIVYVSVSLIVYVHIPRQLKTN